MATHRKRLHLGALMGLAAGLALAGCPDDDPAPDGHSRPDAPRAGDAVSTGQEAAAPQDTGGTRADSVATNDLGFDCSECRRGQVCVHFINSSTCQQSKVQCKDRTEGCYSLATNPCCDCEAQVCGLWSQCARPAACSAPPDGSFNADHECFCYSK